MTTKLTASDRHTLARQCLRDALEPRYARKDIVSLGRLVKDLASPVVLSDSDIEEALLSALRAWREVGK